MVMYVIEKEHIEIQISDTLKLNEFYDSEKKKTMFSEYTYKDQRKRSPVKRRVSNIYSLPYIHLKQIILVSLR